MIAFLQGKILQKTPKSIILLVGDIGYHVFLKNSQLEKMAENSDQKFFIHHYIREETEALYGFENFSELQMFELLISISGIGPKAGLGILEVATPTQLQKAIASGDTTLLTRVSGIGKKIAERVILELKNKVHEFSESSDVRNEITAQVEAMEALESLGYSSTQIREALSQIDPNLSLQEKVKKALSTFSR